MPMEQYRHRNFIVSYGMHGSNFNLITTRGCPYRCNFCDHTVFGYKPISRSIQDVVNEIEHTVKKFNIRNFDLSFFLLPVCIQKIIIRLYGPVNTMLIALKSKVVIFYNIKVTFLLNIYIYLVFIYRKILCIANSEYKNSI